MTPIWITHREIFAGRTLVQVTASHDVHMVGCSTTWEWTALWLFSGEASSDTTPASSMTTTLKTASNCKPKSAFDYAKPVSDWPRYTRNRFQIQRFSAFDWRNWNRFRETIETWSGDGFADKTENGARVYVELFVVIVAKITTKSNIHIFYVKYIKVLW